MKFLNLFKSMRYTASVYSGSMICCSMALGEVGPVSLYAFICLYTVYRKRVGKNKSKGWENEAKRNPFIDIDKLQPQKQKKKKRELCLMQLRESKMPKYCQAQI